LNSPSSYFMKSPPVQYTDDQARCMVEEYIAEGKPATKAAPAAKKTRKAKAG